MNPDAQPFSPGPSHPMHAQEMALAHQREREQNAMTRVAANPSMISNGHVLDVGQRVSVH